MDSDPQIPVNEEYLGKWAVMAKGRYNREFPVKMLLNRYTDSLYAICFTGDLRDLRPYRIAVNDSIKGTAFMSMVNGRQVMNIQAGGQNFIAEFRYEKDQISLLPFAEHFTNKIIKRNSDLRLLLEWHYHSRAKPMYDEGFSLNKMVRVQ